MRAVKLRIIKQGVCHYNERYSKNTKVLPSRLSGLHLYHGVAGRIWNSVISLFLHPAPGPILELYVQLLSVTLRHSARKYRKYD